MVLNNDMVLSIFKIRFKEQAAPGAQKVPPIYPRVAFKRGKHQHAHLTTEALSKGLKLIKLFLIQLFVPWYRVTLCVCLFLFCIYCKLLKYDACNQLKCK